MCALSPLFPSQLGWPLELDPGIHDQHNNNVYLYGDYCTETNSDSFLDELPLSELFDRSTSTPSTANISTGSDLTTVKKLNHNASERDRRKKINHLYSSLRALLPSRDHTVRMHLINIHVLACRVLSLIVCLSTYMV